MTYLMQYLALNDIVIATIKTPSKFLEQHLGHNSRAMLWPQHIYSTLATLWPYFEHIVNSII